MTPRRACGRAGRWTCSMDCLSGLVLMQTKVPETRSWPDGSHLVAESSFTAVDSHRNDDDDAVQDLLVRLAEAQSDEHGGDDSEQEHPDSGACVAPGPAERGPAEDHRGDALE